MTLHGISLVKNEGDIIALFLDHALRWCDFVYVLDNGSTDDTWDVVVRYAKKESRVIPFRQDNRPFANSLRLEVFNAYRSRAKEGDWWCRLDADEFYLQNPREFLPRVPQRHHVVWAIHAQYYLTESDVRGYSLEARGDPPKITWDMLPRRYITDGSEPRFFRYRNRLRWDRGAWPSHMGLVHPDRILLRHYKYRSPAQVQLRLDTRRANGDFPHVVAKDWTECVVRDQLELDDGVSPLRIDLSQLPNHLENREIRFLKRLLHGSGLWP